MNAAFPDALIDLNNAPELNFKMPDQHDKHVLAAAVISNAEWIITANIKDFPADILYNWQVSAIHPDALRIQISLFWTLLTAEVPAFLPCKKQTMSNNISGKVVVITGASNGIGWATAKLLATQGAVLSLAARRKDKLEALVSEITAAGGTARTFVTDVSKRQEVEALIAGTLQAFGKIDVLFNNAGVMPISMLESLHYQEWEQMIDINIKGVLYGIGAVLPHFKAQKSGHFINVSSVAGHLVAPSSAVYSGTKFAVRAISEGLRQEVKPYNIRTSIISPGITESELTHTITDEKIKPMISQMAGMAISADSIARAVAYVIEQPEDVDVNEMIIRPTAQPM